MNQTAIKVIIKSKPNPARPVGISAILNRQVGVRTWTVSNRAVGVTNSGTALWNLFIRM